MRLTDAIVRTGFDGSVTSPMLNIKYGAQFGYTPDLARTIGDRNFDEWVNNAAYVSCNLVPIVLRTPRIFDVLSNRDLGRRMREAYITLMTYAPTKIEGFQATLTLETAEHAIGASGEQHEEFVKASRARTEIEYSFNEKLGKPVNNIFDFLIRYSIKDDQTQAALATTLDLQKGYLTKGDLATPDYWTSTMLFIEPDTINANVVEAYLCTNIAPKTSGEITSKRDITQAQELLDYTIGFTSITRYGESVKAFGQAVLDRMSVFRTNPDEAPLFVDDRDILRNLKSQYNFNKGPLTDVENLKVNVQSKPENVFNASARTDESYLNS